MKIQTTPIKIYSNNKNITVCGRKQQNPISSQPYVINNSPSFKSGVGDIKGTFLNASEKLKDLKKEGINTIYLLPITKTTPLSCRQCAKPAIAYCITSCTATA